MSSFEGELLAIHVTACKGGDATSLAEVEAAPGQGLRGDRYGFGAEEPAARAGGRAAVTLIESEALAALAADHGVELTAAECRRNLLTRGVPLNHLVGREFTIGEVRLEGTELCEPCGYLERRTGKAAREGLVHRGGLRAAVLGGGVLRVGDRITPTG